MFGDVVLVKDLRSTGLVRVLDTSHCRRFLFMFDTDVRSSERVCEMRHDYFSEIS